MKIEKEYVIKMDICGIMNKENKKLVLTLNWWGNLMKWIRGERNTKGIMILDGELFEWELPLPQNVKPWHIKNLTIKTNEKKTSPRKTTNKKRPTAKKLITVGTRLRNRQKRHNQGVTRK